MPIAHFVKGYTHPKIGNTAGQCAVCGYEGSDLLAVNQILDSNTGKINELFRYSTNEICPFCAELWRKPKVWHRSIFATSDRLAFPLIAPEGSIKKAKPSMARDVLQDWSDRPTWRDLIRDRSWWEYERYAVLTTDGQRRIWYKARASKGEKLAIVFHALDRGISNLVVLDLPSVVQILDLVEEIYSNSAAVKTSSPTPAQNDGESCLSVEIFKRRR